MALPIGRLLKKPSMPAPPVSPTGARVSSLVLDGELETELADGRKFTLKPGMSYQVADGAEPHRSSTPNGARMFIVD